MRYTVLLVDYQKMIVRLFLSIVPSLLFTPVMLFLLPEAIKQEFLVLILITGVLIFPIVFYCWSRSVFAKETVDITSSSIVTKKYGEIQFSEIESDKLESFRRTRFKIKLVNGIKLTIAPYNQFSTKANQDFLKFYVNVKKNLPEI